MSQAMNLEAELRDFHTKKYPTIEQTIINNSSVLYKRKKFFLEDVRQSAKYIGFIIIGIIYLRDISMFRLALRAFIQYTISHPYPTANIRLNTSDENKRALTKTLLLGIINANAFCILIHLIFGVYKKSPSSDGYLHGGMSLQFIGERVPYSTLELLILDVIIFFIQLIFHSLMCVVNDSEVLETKKSSTNIVQHGDNESIDKAHIEGDGYNGNVHLINITLTSNIRKVLRYEDKFSNPTNMLSEENVAPIRAPGGFVGV
ncbi:uncharacterized protein RJT21DRAFT_116759 [Scheffersomyces amazonensis]|uniref:uncharacterized protein n=1 Tax=Scheffersomyces amazonensis TaxID=1078765 RepID=UPI00315C9A6D